MSPASSPPVLTLRALLPLLAPSHLALVLPHFPWSYLQSLVWRKSPPDSSWRPTETGDRGAHLGKKHKNSYASRPFVQYCVLFSAGLPPVSWASEGPQRLSSRSLAKVPSPLQPRGPFGNFRGHFWWLRLGGTTAI